MSNSEICFKTAVELARLIGDRKLTPSEVMEAHLEQIESINPRINAIVTLTAEDAMKQAKEAVSDGINCLTFIGQLEPSMKGHSSPARRYRTAFL